MMKTEKISQALNFYIKTKKMVGREGVTEGKVFITCISPPWYAGVEGMWIWNTTCFRLHRYFWGKRVLYPANGRLRKIQSWKYSLLRLEINSNFLFCDQSLYCLRYLNNFVSVQEKHGKTDDLLTRKQLAICFVLLFVLHVSMLQDISKEKISNE